MAFDLPTETAKGKVREVELGAGDKAKKVGGENLTGQAVYDAFFAAPFTEKELMSIFPTLYFTKEAPFSIKDLKVKITTVKNGKYTLAAPGWVPVPPDIKKW